MSCDVAAAKGPGDVAALAGKGKPLAIMQPAADPDPDHDRSRMNKIRKLFMASL